MYERTDIGKISPFYRTWQSKGIADHLMPLGNWLVCEIVMLSPKTKAVKMDFWASLIFFSF